MIQQLVSLLVSWLTSRLAKLVVAIIFSDCIDGRA